MCRCGYLFKLMCVCVCIYMCVCICMEVCVYICTCVYIYVCVRVGVFSFVYNRFYIDFRHLQKTSRAYIYI